MASKKRVSLQDYDLTTTLGTGTVQFNSQNRCRILWTSEIGKKQEIRRVLCDEDSQKGRHH